MFAQEPKTAMTIRYQPIPESDYDAFIRTEAHAFIADPQDARRWIDERQIGDMLRGLFVDERLVAQLMLLPLEVGAGRGTVACGGLGGVATPPEERRNGYVARLLRETCDELRAQGTSLCLLFPFKASFYRRYGWATGMERRRYSGAPALFAPFRKQLHGRFEQAGMEAVDDFQKIYTGALRGRFGPIMRTPTWWEKEVLTEHKKPRYNYIWRDESGTPRSYICYSWEQRPAGTTMVCREIVALDPEARAQLFGFIANHDDQCKDVEFHAPADAPVNLLMPNPLECKVEPYFMLRLIDVGMALSALRYPGDLRGRLTIAVADDWLEHNHGVWSLEVGDGSATCARLPDDAEADLACDVRALAQIFTRYLTPRTAAAFGMLHVNNQPALALLNQMFAGLAPFSSDFF